MKKNLIEKILNRFNYIHLDENSTIMIKPKNPVTVEPPTLKPDVKRLMTALETAGYKPYGSAMMNQTQVYFFITTDKQVLVQVDSEGDKEGIFVEVNSNNIDTIIRLLIENSDRLTVVQQFLQSACDILQNRYNLLTIQSNENNTIIYNALTPLEEITAIDILKALGIVKQASLGLRDLE